MLLVRCSHLYPANTIFWLIWLFPDVCISGEVTGAMIAVTHLSSLSVFLNSIQTMGIDVGVFVYPLLRVCIFICVCVIQTPGLWIEEAGGEQGSPHQRSASWGSADHLKEVGARLNLPSICSLAYTLSAWPMSLAKTTVRSAILLFVIQYCNQCQHHNSLRS